MAVKLRKSFVVCFIFSVVISLSACEHMSKVTAVAGGAGGVYGGHVLANKFGLEGREKTAALVIGGIVGAYAGNKLGSLLEPQDRVTHEQTTNRALTTGQNQSWRNPETRVSGRSEIVKTEKNTATVSVPVLKDKVEQVPPLDFLGETYRADNASNIRGGPGEDYKIVGELNTNDVVNVVGKVQGKDWYMISQNGVGSGFVHAELLSPAPSAMLADNQSPTNTNAAVETKTVDALRTCRTVKQTITLADGREEEEEIKACQGPNGWEVV